MEFLRTEHLFHGKYDINENKKIKLKSICFLEQAKINTIRKLETKESIKLFFEQTIRNLNEKYMLKFLDLFDTMIKEIPFYQLQCDMSQEAVQLSYQTMKEENTNED